MPELTHRTLGLVQVLVHTSRSPNQSEWDAYLSDLRHLSDDVESVRTMVVTLGGSPSFTQRKMLNQILDGRPTRVAVVTPVRVAELAAKALNWFNPYIEAFPLTEDGKGRAYEHLRLTDGEKIRVEQALKDMARELSVDL